MSKPEFKNGVATPNHQGHSKGAAGARPQRSKLGRLWFRLLQLGFRLLYNELAWTYDLVSWMVSLGHWRQWQKTAIPYLQGTRILEIAHGPGHMLVELDRMGLQVAGIDLSPFMVKMASRNIRKAGRRIHLARADVRSLPLAAHAMDSILSTFPAEFIFDSGTVRELHRVLKPGGRVVIVAEGRLKGGGLIRGFIDWLFAITGQRTVFGPENGGDLLWRKIAELVQTTGFSLTIENIDLAHSDVNIVVLTKLID